MLRDLRDKIRSIEQKQEEKFQYLQSIIENSKDDNKYVFIIYANKSIYLDYYLKS